jgi:hypothetical protein
MATWCACSCEEAQAGHQQAWQLQAGRLGLLPLQAGRSLLMTCLQLAQAMRVGDKATCNWWDSWKSCVFTGASVPSN